MGTPDDSRVTDSEAAGKERGALASTGPGEELMRKTGVRAGSGSRVPEARSSGIPG